MSSDLMIEGSKLLVLGMGSVFLFLVVLVFAMKIMSSLANILDSGEPQAVSAGASPARQETTGTDAIVPVIAAAIAAYRKNHK